MDDIKNSKFVTVVAWLFIGASAYMIFISIFQNVMISTIMPMDEFNKPFESDMSTSEIPFFSEFFFTNFDHIIRGSLILEVLFLISSIGLLKRRNWARIGIIIFLLLGIIINISALLFQIPFMSEMLSEMPETPTEFSNKFKMFGYFAIVFSGLFTIAITVLLGWIIKKLLSENIKKEFVHVP